MRFLIWACLCIGLASAAQAEDKQAILDFGGDAFRAGASVTFTTVGTDDLFMAGETVNAAADITGSATLAGRKVIISGRVGGDAYAFGMTVNATGLIGGDATLSGYDVTTGQVGGDLRASGAEITVNGPVAGYALLSGGEVSLNAPVEGDVAIAARDIEFGSGARIMGTLTLYEKTPGTLDVPENVVPSDRVVRNQLRDWNKDFSDVSPLSLGKAIAGFLVGVVVVAGLAALVASLVPDQLASIRRQILARPFGTLWFGFLALSALLGSAILFAMTLIGIVFSPAVVFLAALAGFAGYVIGAYAFGVGLMLAFGRLEPDSIGERALAAGIGALAAGLLALIPFLGWLFVMALTLAGAGGMVMKIFAPRFFAPDDYRGY